MCGFTDNKKEMVNCCGFRIVGVLLEKFNASLNIFTVNAITTLFEMIHDDGSFSLSLSKLSIPDVF